MIHPLLRRIPSTSRSSLRLGPWLQIAQKKPLFLIESDEERICFFCWERLQGYSGGNLWRGLLILIQLRRTEIASSSSQREIWRSGSWDTPVIKSFLNSLMRTLTSWRKPPAIQRIALSISWKRRAASWTPSFTELSVKKRDREEREFLEGGDVFEILKWLMEFLSLSFFFARKYGVSFGSKERKREGSGRSHHQRNQAASFQENSETEEEKKEESARPDKVRRPRKVEGRK